MIARGFVVLLLAGLLSGCYAPPVWDAFDPIDQVHKIKPGVTTKKEVIGILGEPDVMARGRLRYSGSKSDGWFAIGGALGGWAGTINERPWHLEVQLGNDGIVRSVRMGCSAPAIFHPDGPFGKVHNIKTGETIRSEVLKMLGKPNVALKNKLRYYASKSAGSGIADGEWIPLTDSRCPNMHNFQPPEYHVEIELTQKGTVKSINIRHYTCLRCPD